MKMIFPHNFNILKMKKTYIFVLMICIQSLNIVSAQNNSWDLSLNANGRRRRD